MAEPALQQYDPQQYAGPKEFVHLHAHTVYSFLDGCATPEQYARQCSERNYPAMAATEHGHMGSVPDMYLAFKQVGLKYIPGCEVYYCDWELKRQQLIASGEKIRSKEWKKDNEELYLRLFRSRHLTLLCKNEIGFQNLLKLTTQAYKTGRYVVGKNIFNRIWFEKLCEYKEGLIVLSGCLNGPASHEIRFQSYKTGNKEDNDETIVERDKKGCIQSAYNYIKKFKREFGDDFYIELQMPGVEKDEEVFKVLLGMADMLKIKTALTNDCHYITKNDHLLQKIMMAISQGTNIYDENLFYSNSEEQFMKSRPELWSHFKNNPKYSLGVDDGKFEEMCDNTLEIADKIEKLNIDASPKIPTIQDAEEQLKNIIYTELKQRNLYHSTKKYIVDGNSVTHLEQAEIELDRFISKGFAGYLLITYYIIEYGKKMGNIFTPRGSAGGSIICYLLGISSLDPLEWGLSFDRFLSKARGGYLLNVRM